MKHNNFPKYLIYKRDNWNMLTVEVQGMRIIVREISEQWGEENHTFLSRPAMMHWVEQRFPEVDFVHNAAEREDIFAKFRAI